MDKNVLLHGDCLELMSSIADNSIDMICADLPYGTTLCSWDTIIPLEPLWEQYKRVIKPRGAIVLTASQPFTTTLISSNLGWFKYCWVWNKKKGGTPLIAKLQPIKITEDIVVFGNGRTNYYPIMTNRNRPWKRGGNKGKVSETTNNAFTENKVYIKRYPKNIIESSNAYQHGKVHPTQKPVALMEYLIRTYTNEGEIVLDNVMGSGTTGVACIRTGRQFIGIELDKGYFEIAKNRIADEESKMPLLKMME